MNGHYASHQLHDPNVFPSAHPTLVSQPDISIVDSFQFDPQLENQAPLNLQSHDAFQTEPFTPRDSQQQAPRFHEIRPSHPSQTPQTGVQILNFGHSSPYAGLSSASRQRSNDPHQGGSLFGVLGPSSQLPTQPSSHDEAFSRLQNEIDLRPQAVSEGGTTEGHFSSMKMVPNPPDLDAWRQRLFDVDDMISLTEDEYVVV